MSDRSPPSKDESIEEIGSLAAALVEIPSENPPGNESPAARFVHEWLTREGITAELIEEPDPDRVQVAAHVGTAAGPTVVLNGHLDVVPAGDRDRWSVDPYGGTIEDGRLYGRGSADMKTGLAIAMCLLRELAPELRSGDLPGSVVFHAAMGEETANPGTKTLLERGYGGDFGIVLEPTDFRVATSTMGLAVYRIAVHGESTHASQPDTGENPIDAARPLLAAIDDYDRELQRRDTTLAGAARATVTEFESGVGSNLGVIPDTATLVLDRRVPPGESIDAVDSEIHALLDRVQTDYGLDATIERIQTYESSSIPIDHPLARLLQERSVEAVGPGGGVAEPWGIEAATDARNFVNDAGIPAVTWGPGRLEEAHTADESISLADAAIGREILTGVVRTLLRDKE
ncbi:M20 family metallopeptidase [Halalkalirubrum salinum]|uniref:M20 family metallopeptidase n=1 Tax=Halalkalirubrum salinum TaxID=2563889 RepID=UPI0010FBBD13|nr:M20 family metallopeptidase [Halalkalirubrum salinum]